MFKPDGSNNHLNYSSAICPVCNYSIGFEFYFSDPQPLSTISWPSSSVNALSMKRLPLDFVQCARCSHVWNKSFSYTEIPYSDLPNRMYNRGDFWKGHLGKTRDLILSVVPEYPTIIDVGCGDGHFVSGLAKHFNGKGRFVGFDPNTSAESGRGLEFHARIFDPENDAPTFEPDCIVLRHVLEHLVNPGEFLQGLAWAASSLSNDLWLFAEVPCIDRVFETGRLSDFFYEHVSHFTTKSFERLLRDAGEISVLETGYNGEVAYALLKLGVSGEFFAAAQKSNHFAGRASNTKKRIRAQLSKLAQLSKENVIWGGTGKAAAFMNNFECDAESFPLVVDSDPLKVGTFVPGVGQKIRSPDDISGLEIETIIVPAQWRAKDIVKEVSEREIVHKEVLIEHDGNLVSYYTDAHPYE